MKKDLLLEILVQELPYKFIPSAISQLEIAFEKLFKENALSYKKINVYATPRRLAVLVDELAVCQETVSKNVKGPIISVAKNEAGEYTPAAIGFAKKNGVDVSMLYEKDNYIWVNIETKGKTVAEILKENIQNLILKLQGSHFMRWQYNTEKFSRPIENVVALLDDEIVELEILGKKSTNKTLGHRYSKNLELTIKNPKSYIETLRTGNVIVNQEERRDLIIKLTKECAEKNNLVIKFDNTGDLLEEITYITEYPVPVICEFNEKYLQIPDIVTTTVMISHQRYFPLWNKDGKLSNKFITIANYVGDEFENIKAGNQRVVVARLDDGIFFFEEDTKTKLIDKIDNLKGMTFQKGLGTLYDKTQRIIKLSDKIADKLNIKDKTDILRCAELSKCDLSTKLVFEFTELQGFIGEDYALFDKEKPEVAKGICEHYFPLNANSELPESIIGQVVSIADKIDTVCALFISTQGDKKKKRPTGSNDPLGARRAVIGIIRIILENNLNINLEEIIKTSLDMLSKEFNTSMEDCLLEDIKDFFNSRITFMFEKEISSNVFNSIKSFNSLENLSGYITKAKILNKYQNDENFSIIKENASRVFKILKDNKFEDIKEALFSTNEEKELYKAITMHNVSPDNLEEYIISLNALIKPIINFFDNVLVMDKDEKIKNNRIALLNKLRNKFNVVCEFDKL